MHDIARRAIETADTFESMVADFYGPTGPLVSLGWEIRTMQRDMSMEIARQLDAHALAPVRGEDGRFIDKPRSWGVVEAPCGTGKSGAYGVPAILAALRGRARFNAAVAKAKADGNPDKAPKEPEKAIITTANIALQEQIVKKDLPALAKVLGVTLDVRLLKGRNNYLCRWKIRSSGAMAMNVPAFRQAVEWMQTPGCDGDKESMPFQAGESWGDLSVTNDECLGQGCKHFGKNDEAGEEGKPCFWREAVQGHAQAHVIVTNHHYITLARPLRSCLLAVDEMHELENSLRSTQSRQLTDYAGRGLVAKLEAWIPKDRGHALLEVPVRWLMLEAAERYRGEVQSYGGKTVDSPVTLRTGWLPVDKHAQAIEYADAMVDLIDQLETVCTELGCFRDGSQMHPPKYSPHDPERVENAAKAAKAWMQLCGVHERFTAVADGLPYETWPGGESPWAIYVERIKRKDQAERFTVTMTPADVAWATAALARAYPVTCLTSATVPDFKSLKLSLGLLGEDGGGPVPVYTNRLPSPYPLATMAVTVIPHLANPSKERDRWVEDAVCTVIDAVRLARGRTLVLSSSTAMMWKYAVGLRDVHYGAPEYPVKVQGEMGRGELREWFKTNDENGVLCATRSFFQGLDVQGDNCVCVIIDRVPFSSPGDPVENAVGQLLVDRAGGGNAFILRSTPQAAMVLAQGAGRLIRAQTDRGALIILDPRLVDPGECWELLRAALPPFPISRKIEDVANVLNGSPLVGVPPPPPPPRGRSLRRTREATP